MTPKQERFVEEYLVDLNATQAAIRAGYSAKTAEQQGSRLLSNVQVSKAVQAKRAALSEKTGITIERTARELAALAFANVKALVHSDGTPKAIHELTDEEARGLTGLDVVSIGNAQVGEGQVLKYKLDKRAAAEALMRHLGGFEKDNNQSKPQVTITGFRVVSE
jgi:phage terminase small subunit